MVNSAGLQMLLDEWNSESTDLSTAALGQRPFAALREHPARYIAIPSELGGGGGTAWDAAVVQHSLARLSPSVAVAFCMHSHAVGALVSYWRSRRDTTFLLLEAVATAPLLLGSAFAEPDSRRSLTSNHVKLISTGTDSPYLNGTKAPCSLISSADIFCVGATDADTDEFVVALVPAAAVGVVAKSSWDGVGMCDSDTGVLKLNNVRVDSKLIVHRSDGSWQQPDLIASYGWFVTLMAASYHGALVRLVEAVDGDSLTKDSDGEIVGQIVLQLVLVKDAIKRSSRLLDAGEFGQSSLLTFLALRTSVAAICDDVCGSVRSLIGSRVYRTSANAQLWADIGAVHFHPPPLRVCRASAGAFFGTGALDLGGHG